MGRGMDSEAIAGGAKTAKAGAGMAIKRRELEWPLNGVWEKWKHRKVTCYSSRLLKTIVKPKGERRIPQDLSLLVNTL